MSKPDYLRTASGKYANYTHAPFWAAYDKEDGKWEVRVYNDGPPASFWTVQMLYFGAEDTRRARGIHRLVDGVLLTLKVAHATAE